MGNRPGVAPGRARVEQGAAGQHTALPYRSLGGDRRNVPIHFGAVSGTVGILDEEFGQVRGLRGGIVAVHGKAQRLGKPAAVDQQASGLAGHVCLFSDARAGS